MTVSNCPKSVITATSIKLLEYHSAVSICRDLVSGDAEARSIDALALLEHEREKENRSEYI